MSSEVNRIYNVVVLLGLELAVQGCGGNATKEPASGESNGAGGGSSSSGNDATVASNAANGTAAGIGGASTTTTSTGGIISSETSSTGFGTDGSAGAPPGPEGLPCPASQWSCSNPQCVAGAYLDAMDCSCDPERPTSEDDCAADERFVCNQYAGEDGVAPFSCLCVPSSTDCYAACYAVSLGNDTRPSAITPGCATRTVLCDCAYPTILK